MSKKKREEEERKRRRKQEERDRHRRRQQGEEEKEAELGVPVGGAGGVEHSQGSVTQTVPVLLGPTVQVAGAEARVGDPMTQSGLAIAPGPAVVKRGRGRPKKNPLVDATIGPSAPGAGEMPRGFFIEFGALQSIWIHGRGEFLGHF